MRRNRVRSREKGVLKSPLAPPLPRLYGQPHYDKSMRLPVCARSGKRETEGLQNAAGSPLVSKSSRSLTALSKKQG